MLIQMPKYSLPLVLGIMLHSGRAAADAPAINVENLEQLTQAQRYELQLGSGSIRAGGAAIVVHANAAAVRAIVTDFGAYEKFLPHFQRSRVIARKAEGTDVYLQVPILHGAAKIWAVARFTPARTDKNGEHVEGHMIGPGNIDDFRAVWHIRPLDEQRTLLRLELLIVPKLPLPHSLITTALEESAQDGVRACRSRAEQDVKH